jgi:hypothetical protein
MTSPVWVSTSSSPREAARRRLTVDGRSRRILNTERERCHNFFGAPDTGISVPAGTRPDAPGRSSRPVLGRVVTAPTPSCSFERLPSTRKIPFVYQGLASPPPGVGVSSARSTAPSRPPRLLGDTGFHEQLRHSLVPSSYGTLKRRNQAAPATRSACAAQLGRKPSGSGSSDRAAPARFLRTP